MNEVPLTPQTPTPIDRGEKKHTIMSPSDKKIIKFMLGVGLLVLIFLVLTSIIGFKYLEKNSDLNLNANTSSFFTDLFGSKNNIDEYIEPTRNIQNINENTEVVNKNNSSKEEEAVELFPTSESDSSSSLEVIVETETATKEQRNTNLIDEPIQLQEPEPEIDSCVRYRIFEDEFESYLCYTEDDYEAIRQYISDYRRAGYTLRTSESTITATCDGFSETFQELCEEAKDEKAQAEEDIENLTENINNIIDRGTEL